MKKILVTDGMESEAVSSLRANGFEVTEKFFEPDELKAHLGEYDAVVVRSATKVRESVIAEAKKGKLKLIVRGGVGVDNIDVAFAEANGVAVRNTPRASSNSVAELALAHIFALARFVFISNVTMRNGEWNKKKYEGTDIAGKTLGIVGFGKIGSALAEKAHALGMKILVNMRSSHPVPDYVEVVSFEELMHRSDFVSLHIPTPADKKPIITAENLAMMKKTAFLINTARGILVDEDVLCDAIDNGVIAGAGLDVFLEEPTTHERIYKNPKISLTPHIGGSTKEAQSRIGAEIVDIITGFFAEKE